MEQKFEIAAAASHINWLGRKVTGAHNGTIDLKRGNLSVKDGQLTGGGFTIDTTSIRILDITDPATNAQFAGHLASDDFFAWERYPEAHFKITAVRGNRVEGNLTIKDITQAIGFDAVIGISDDTLTASGKIVIDRTRYDIRFRSGNFFKDLGDTLIYNDFELDVTLIAKALA